MWSPGLSEVLAGVQSAALAELGGGGGCGRERFLQLVRDQARPRAWARMGARRMGARRVGARRMGAWRMGARRMGA